MSDENRTEWVKLYEDGSIAKPGELPSNTGGLKHERLATD